MPGTPIGALRTAARRVGLTESEYAARVEAGEKWCTACKAWHPRSAFVADRSRGDGLRARCLASERGRKPYAPPKYPDRHGARMKVHRAVRSGRLSDPNQLACTDCGHRGQERRHEYDHHLGYAKEHWLSVEVVCTTCHADREKARRRSAA